MTQYVVFLALAPCAAAAAGTALLFALRDRKRIGFSTLAPFLLCQLLYLIGNFLEFCVPTPGGTLAFAKADYLFISLGPVLWFLFAMEYSGNDRWLRAARVALLLIIPALTFSFALADDVLHLIWRAYRFEPAMGMLVMRVEEYGPWLWVHFLYGYALMLSGGVAIFVRFFQSNSFFRRQSSLVIVGVILPLGFNFIYLLKLIPGLTKDFSPLAFALGAVCFAFGIMRLRLARVAPLSRSKLMDSLAEAIIVIDLEQRLVDMNRAAAGFLGVRDALVIGEPAARVFPGWDALRLPRQGESSRLRLGDATRNESHQPIDLRISAISLGPSEPLVYQAAFFPDQAEPPPVEELLPPAEPEPALRFPRRTFSERERQILELLRGGATNKEIGERLSLSPNTVKFHLKAISAKAGTGRRPHLARISLIPD